MAVNFSVELSDDEPFERALRRFSSKTKRTGLMRDLKRKRFYTKPSVQKKLDLQKSIRRRKKAERITRLAEMGLDRRGRKRR
jgi:small subunit ribosomal protein S21